MLVAIRTSCVLSSVNDESFKLHAESEEAIYAALGLPYIEPHNRESEYLQNLARQ